MKLYELETQINDIFGEIKYLNANGELTIRKLIELGINNIYSGNYKSCGYELEHFTDNELDIVISGYMGQDSDCYTCFYLDSESSEKIKSRLD